MNVPSELQYRTALVNRAAVDQKARTVELSFSSEEVVERYFGNEVLDHSPGSVDLSRLQNAGPLLVDHDPVDQVGVIERAWIGDDRKGRAVVRFGKSARASEIFDDVVGGIRKLISVGYKVLEPFKKSVEDGVEILRSFRWQALEISIVAVPADSTVGIGRTQQRTKSMNTPPNDQEDTLNAEKREILAIGKHFGKNNPEILEMANRAVLEGTTLESFRLEVLAALPRPKEIPGLGMSREYGAEIGMGRQDLKNYSLRQAILEASEHGGQPQGLVREASNAVAKLTGRQPRGFFVPADIMSRSLEETRGLLAGTSTAGGYTVPTEILSGSMIDLLRNKIWIVKLGARLLSGLSGNASVPKLTGAATAYWLGEVESVPDSEEAFGQMLLVPHRLAANVPFSKELLIQSSTDVEALVRNDLMTVLAIEKDRVAINGGGGSQPLGILQTSGLSTTVHFGAAATFAKMVEFETNVANNNADEGSLAYVTTPTVRGKLKTKLKDSVAGAGYIWEDDRVNGYPARATKQVPSDKVIFGDFSALVIGDWGGLDVIVDVYSKKKTAQIEVSINQWTDLGLRTPLSFCTSDDSGAQ